MAELIDLTNLVLRPTINDEHGMVKILDAKTNEDIGRFYETGSGLTRSQAVEVARRVCQQWNKQTAASSD